MTPVLRASSVLSVPLWCALLPAAAGAQPLPGFDVAPRASLMQLQGPDAAGQTTIVGAAGAVPAGAALYIVNLNTGHIARASAAADGSFTASIFAPAGTSISVKQDPEGNGNDPQRYPGGILRVPEPASSGSALSFAGAGLTDGVQAGISNPTVGVPWTFTGTLTPRDVAPGGSIRAVGALRLASPLLQSAGAMTGTALLFVERLTNPDGTPYHTRNTFVSAFMTPTGLPIEGHRNGAGAQVPFTLVKTAVDRAEAAIDVSFALPADALAGYYRATIVFSFVGTPTEAAGDRFIRTDPAGRTPQPFNGVTSMFLPVVRVGAAAPPRVFWTLLTDTIANGARGARAAEDQARFGVVPRVVHNPDTFIVPRLDPRTGAPAVYRLDPYVTTIGTSERGGATSDPLIPFKFPSGALTARIVRPDGSSVTIGPAPFAQFRTRGVFNRNGFPITSGGGFMTEPYQLGTMNPAFETTFAQDGRHVITLEGTIEDLWGNVWAGGGTYEVFVARTLSLDTAAVPGTSFEVGDALAAGTSLTPAVPADVTVRVRLAPGSDAARMIDRTVRGRANRFGYFSPRGGVPLDEQGEYRVDVIASYTDAAGNLWMGARTYAGVVAPRSAPFILHGQRGIDDQQTSRQQWFFRTQTGRPIGTGHVNIPFHSGDVAWLQDSDSMIPLLTFQDPSNAIVSRLTSRFQPCGIGDPSIGEVPFCSSRPDGLDVQFDPSKTDIIGYTYRAIERPLVGVREEISEQFVVAPYWRFNEPYGDQLSVDGKGDLPNDFKFQYGGGVWRGSAFASPQYAIYGSLFVLVPDVDPDGGTRVFPPFQGNGGGPSGGPLFRLKGRSIDAFAHLTAVRPGTVLETGDTFAIAGALAPTLPGLVNATVQSPSGQVRTFQVRANKVGYFYNPAHDFVVTEPGIYTVDVTATFDGQTSAGQLTAPFPTGDVLGTSNGRFFVYAVTRSSAPLDANLPSQTLGGDATFTTIASAPAGMTLTDAHATSMMPGFVLTSGDVSRTANAMAFTHSPGALATDFPNLDTNLPADVVTVTLFGTGTSGGQPTYAAKVLALHGSDLFNMPHAAASTATDTDADGLPNDWEAKFAFNAALASGADGADGDPDADGVTNLAEYQFDTHPLIPNTWNLPEGATGFFTERIAVANPTDTDAVFNVTFLKEGGAPIVQSYTLPAQRRATITVNDVPGLSSAAVSAVSSTSKGGVVVERTMLWDARDGSNYGGHTGKAIANARTTWYLAEGEASFFDTYILLANATASTATVTLSFLLENGNTIVDTRAVPANARVTVYANDVPGLRGNAFSTTITSTVPITVERAMYFGNNVRTFNGGHEAAAVAAPATSWFVAEGRTGPFFDTYLLLANPGTAPATVTITFLTPGGGTVGQTRTLNPTSRTTIHVDSVTGLTDTDVSASIVSTQPIIVERAMYWPDPFSSWYEAHSSAGVTATGTQWALAEGEVGGPQGFETYILLANPNAANASVTLTFLRANAAPLTLTRTVPANGRLTVSAAEALLASGEKFGILIDASQPIAVERAMYWNGGAQFWGAGTNETAVRIR